MKEFSQKSLDVLERYCDYAAEIVKCRSKGVSEKIVEKIRENVKYERKIVHEGNFAYYYDEISNFEEIFGAGYEILDVKEEITRNLYSNLLRFIKEYKVLLKTSKIVYLNVSYELVQLSLGRLFSEAEGFHTPIYACRGLSIYLWQNGFKCFVKGETYSPCTDYRCISKIIENLKVQIEYSKNPYYDIQIYDNENLVLEEKDHFKEHLRDFLLNMLEEKTISAEGLKFKKEITVKPEEITETFWLNVYFSALPECKYTYKLNCKAQKTICTLTNKAGIKIVITQFLNDLKDQEVTLAYFKDEILKKQFDDIRFNMLYNVQVTDKTPILKTKSGNELEVGKMEPVAANNVRFDLKKEKNIFLPINTYFKDAYLSKCTLLKEFVSVDKNEAYLIQYFSSEVVIDESNHKIILRMVYKMKDTTYSFGGSKLENVILPYPDLNRSCVIIFDKDVELDLSNINQNQFYRTYSPYLAADSCARAVENFVFEQCYGKDAKYNIYSLLDGCDFFEESEELDFSKLEQVNFDGLYNSHLLFREIKEELSEEFINTLVELYS